MKPPKNFYSNLDRRKQGLENGIPDIPTPSAEDIGKVIKVGSDGYELAADESLPVVTSDDNGVLLQVQDGVWKPVSVAGRRLLSFGSNKYASTTYDIGVRFVKSSDGIVCSLFGVAISFSALSTYIRNVCLPCQVVDGNDTYYGVFSETSGSTYRLVCVKDDNFYKIDVTNSTITITPLSNIRYFEITATGSSVSLPSGVTFADVYALLQAGVDVKFTSGARIYSITSVESTNIRAHWISDLDLTSIEVYVINIASDGTGTVASATFSGS